MIAGEVVSIGGAVAAPRVEDRVLLARGDRVTVLGQCTAGHLLEQAADVHRGLQGARVVRDLLVAGAVGRVEELAVGRSRVQDRWVRRRLRRCLSGVSGQASGIRPE